MGNKKFVNDIIACTNPNHKTVNEIEAKKRSPLYWKVPLRINSTLVWN